MESQYKNYHNRIQESNMIITKKTNSEIEEFMSKFKNKKYHIESSTDGKITLLNTDDQEILDWAKTLGLK